MQYGLDKWHICLYNADVGVVNSNERKEGEGNQRCKIGYDHWRGRRNFGNRSEHDAEAGRVGQTAGAEGRTKDDHPHGHAGTVYERQSGPQSSMPERRASGRVTTAWSHVTYRKRFHTDANMVEENRTKLFRSDRIGSKAQNAPLKIKIAFCNLDSSNVNAPGAFTSLRTPGQEHFTYSYRLGANYKADRNQ